MRIRRSLATLTAATLGISGAAVVLPAAPAAAAAPTRILNTSSGGGMPNWLETDAIPDDGSGRRVTVTFLAEHAAGRRITSVFVDNDLRESNQTFSVTPQIYPGPTTNGLETSRVTLTFDPGKSPDFGCSLNPFGGNRTRRVTRNLGFRLTDDAGGQSQLVTSSVTQVEDAQCVGADDYPEMHDQSQSATTATPGQDVTFQFRADDADSSGSHDHFDQYRWRLRSLNDGFVTAATNVNPGGNNDNQLISLTTDFPSRGRWVVEAELGTEDGYGQSSGWFRLGGVDVNSGASSLSGSIAFPGALTGGLLPSVNQGTPIDAVASVSDSGGAVQVIEWDAQGNGSYERREYTVPSAGDPAHPFLTSAERTQAVDTGSPGIRTVNARIVDNGALDASDDAAHAAAFSGQLRVNAIPSAGSFATSTAEDTSKPITLVGSDGDDQPAALTFTVQDQPAHGDLDCTGAACVYSPHGDYAGPDSFTYTVADGPVTGQAWATSSTATVDITVTPVNDAPTAAAQDLTTDEDAALPVALGATDVESGSLTFDIVSGPSHGALGGTGANRTYTPAADFHGTDSFIFSATDSEGLAGTATVSITVTPVNDAPDAIDQTVNATEDTPVNITLAAGDVDGDTVTFVAPDTPPAHGEVLCVGAACTYTPHADHNGSDSFTFVADDGTGAANGTDVGTITVNVAAVNDPPEAVAQAVTLDEDTAVGITAEATDVDGDALTFDVATAPAHGTVVPAGGPVLTYTPAAEFHGGDQFEFRASDPGGLSDTAIVVLTVNPVNDAPTLVDQSYATDEDVPAIVSVAATDVDGDPLAFSVVTEPQHGALTGDLPDIAYLPEADFHGVDTFEVAVDDGQGGTATAVMTVTVAPVDDRPVAEPTTVTTDEDSAVSFALVGTDADGDELGYSVTTTAAHGELACVEDLCTYTPDADFNGSDLAIFEVSDGTTSDSASVSIAVTAVNDPPVTSPLAVTTDEDVPVAITLTATDVDGDELTFATADSPAHGTLEGSAPSLVYTPSPDFSAGDGFAYTVSDGEVDVAGLVVIDVTAVNDAPHAVDASASLDEDGSVDFTLSATDVDDSDLTFTVDDPDQGQVTCTGTDCTYTAAPDFSGTVTFGFEVSDGELSDFGLVTIDVNGENDAPVAPTSTELHTAEDVPVGATLQADDVDGDELTYEVTTPPEHGSLTGTAPELVYTPDPDFHGSDTFGWQASDGQGGSVASTVLIEVESVNDLPVALPLVVDTDEDAPVSFSLLADDADGDAVSFSAAAPGHGTVDCSTDGDCTYTPDADFAGVDSFTFTAVDHSGEGSEATVTLTVTGAPLVGTRLVAQPLLLTLGPVFEARLTRADTGAPIAGQTLRFTAGGKLRCQAVTDANGRGRCGTSLLDLPALLNLGYEVGFAGDADHAAARAKGQLLLRLRLW